MLASEYGIKNLQRILPNAIDWTKEEAKDYTRAEEVYDNVFGQFRRYIGHVTKWIGGIFDTPKTYDQSGIIFEPAPKDMQKKAVSFLQKNLFQPPMWLIDQQITNKLKAENGVKRLADLQQSTIDNLYSTDRLQRLIDANATNPATYGLEEFFNDMKNGIWSEFKSGVEPSIYRRNLQKIHLEKIISLLETATSSNGSIGTYFRSTSSVDPVLTDIRSLAMGTLNELHFALNKQGSRSGDRITKLHYQDCSKRIEKALEMDE
jgi:hypothetical protein